MKLWPFNRNQNQGVLPEEVKEYYQVAKKEQTGVAWLLAFGTLIVTILLAIVIFFAGRWAYQKIFNSDDQKPTETEQTTDQPGEVTTEETEQFEDELSDQNGGGSSDDTLLPGDDTNDEVEPDETPVTGPSEPELPATGPTTEVW